MNCRHLGKVTGVRCTAHGEEANHACNHPAHKTTTRAACLTCPDFMGNRPVIAGSPVSTPGAVLGDSKCRHPTGVIVDRYDRPANVADLFLGASAFAVLGGPSCRNLPLTLLGQRGCLIFSTNNCPAILPPTVRPHCWIFTDPTHKFHDSLWRDPAVMKFAPVREWDGRTRNPTTEREKARFHKHKHKGLRTRDAAGNLVWRDDLSGRDMPGVFGYHRNTSFDPDKWLWEPTINRGNDKDSAYGKGGSKGNGHPHCINTMFAVIRLAFYLGIKRLYLVGCDFRMEKDRQYAFDQGKHDGGCDSNNRAYLSMCGMFDALRPRFDAAGFTVMNTNPASCLWSFDFIKFEDAVAEATAGIEQTMNTKGWYDDPRICTDDPVSSS